MGHFVNLYLLVGLPCFLHSKTKWREGITGICCMVLITTIKNIFIIQAIKHMPWRNCSHVKVISVDEYSLLDSDFDAHCFRDEQTLLLLVFPDNDLAACVRSLRFLNQWSEKKHLNIPCLVWGDGVMGINIGMPTIPWKLTKDEFFL